MKVAGLREEVLQFVEDEIFRLGRARQLIERDVLKRYGIKARQTRNYIKAARDRWRDSRSERREEMRDELEAIAREFIGICLTTKDTRGGAAWWRNLADLFGALEPTKVQVSGGVAMSIEPDPEKAKARLAELRAKQGA